MYFFSSRPAVHHRLDDVMLRARRVWTLGATFLIPAILWIAASGPFNEGAAHASVAMSLAPGSADDVTGDVTGAVPEDGDKPSASVVKVLPAWDALTIDGLVELERNNYAELAQIEFLRRAIQLAEQQDDRRLTLLRRQHLQALMEIGHAELSLATYERLSKAERQAVMSYQWTEGKKPYHLNLAHPTAMYLGLAAAYLLADEPSKAEAVLAQLVPEDQLPEELPGRYRSHDERAAARQQGDRSQILWAFEHVLQSSTTDPFTVLANLANSEERLDVSGLIYRVLIRWALREGYDGFAQYFADRWRVGLTMQQGQLRPVDPNVWHFSRRFPHWKTSALERLETLEGHYEALQLNTGNPNPDVMSTRLESLLRRPRLVPFRELLLPEGIEVGSDKLTPLPSSVKPPGELRLVRWQDVGEGEWVVVGVSQALDPTGEVSPGGYWVLHSLDDGEHWQWLYTGIRKYDPYVVTADSALPMVTADGLRLEVGVRKVDPKSISFPPVAMRLKESRDGLMLELPWQDLRRDADGDGLTDLMEERLVTDPERRDTDGDGLDDRLDPLPTVPMAASRNPEDLVLAAVLRATSNDAARAILPSCIDMSGGCFGRPVAVSSRVRFVSGDRLRWQGLAPDRRTIVLHTDEMVAASKKFGPSFGMRFPLFVLDRSASEAVVVWGRSWKGGTLWLRLQEDGWQVVKRSSWIT